MATKIKADTLQALDAWKAGKPVRSIELGHVQQMTHSEDHLKAYPNTRPQIDLTQRVSVDQECAHAYLFHLLDLFSLNGVPESHEAFLAACDDFEKTFEWGELPVEQRHQFDAERNAAESLAWKALLLGWRRAIDGFPEAHYIEVTNPAVAAK